MLSYDDRSCAYCRCPISIGQRWVREKIYEPPRANQLPAYRHFHAESFGSEDLSCWERYWTEREIARMAIPVGQAGTVEALAFVS